MTTGNDISIALLQLQPGRAVPDVGVGTGLSHAPLRAGVGGTGRVLAFGQRPDMFALAQQRVQREGWANVWHASAAAETVQLPVLADAVLVNHTHDICRSPAAVAVAVAVANILRQVKPGARVAMAGIKDFPWWTGPLDLLARLKGRPCKARAADLSEPWIRLTAPCKDFRWNSTQWGMGYIASATLKGAPR